MTVIVVAAAAVVLLAGCVVVVAGWFASERVLSASQPPYEPRAFDVIAVGEGTVVLPVTAETSHAGVYGLTWPGGHAVIGDIFHRDGPVQTRRVLDGGGALSPSLRVRRDIFVHRGDPDTALGVGYTEVSIPGELGGLPAWLVAGEHGTWALLVHGLRATREEGLRILPTLRELGLPTLLLTYRNDAGAPTSPDGYIHLGDTEWRDLEAAVDWALANGAERVVLYGWSMGGTIIEAFLRRSARAGHVQAVVLDAPVLDWLSALDTQVRALHLPHWFTHVLAWFARRKTGVDFAALDQTRPPAGRPIPTLLWHGTDDRLVPIGCSDRFARHLSGQLVYHRVGAADHTESWNVDPSAYEQALAAFLRQACPELSADGVRR